MHLIWGDLSLKHTQSIFLTFLSFSRSHNSLFTWTCCLFLSLSVPSRVRNRGLQGAQTCSGFDVIYVIFWGIFQFYLFSLILFRFCCFTPEKPRSCCSLLRYLYIWNSKHFYFIIFFISLKWPHLITVIIFACWDHRGPRDVFFNNQMLKEMLHILLNQEPNGVKSFIHSDNDNLRNAQHQSSSQITGMLLYLGVLVIFPLFRNVRT